MWVSGTHVYFYIINIMAHSTHKHTHLSIHSVTHPANLPPFIHPALYTHHWFVQTHHCMQSIVSSISFSIHRSSHSSLGLSISIWY